MEIGSELSNIWWVATVGSWLLLMMQVFDWQLQFVSENGKLLHVWVLGQFDENLTQFCKFIAHNVHRKLKRTDWIQNHMCAWNCCVFSWNGSYMDGQYIHVIVLIQLLLPCFTKTHQWTIWVWKAHQGWSSAFMCVSLSRYEVTIVQKFGP